MTSVLHYRYVREVNLSVPETSSFIHLASTQEPNQIRGKVQIQNTYPIENYYGLVIELCGLVKFTTGPRNIEHIFGVDKNSSTVLKSQVYCQILGCAEALEKGTLPSKLKSVVLPGSHIIEFQLILPKNRPLPPSMSGKYVEVTYNIILYKRTQENGYKPMGDRFKKLINFHGFNPLQTVQPLSSMLWENPVVQPFSGCGISGALQIPKTNYLKQEEIAFHVQIEKDGTNVSQVLAKCVKVSLLKTVIANYSTEVEELDSFITNKDYFNEGNNNVCVKGVFTSKRDHPSYKDLTIGGLLIIHNIKVEVTTDEGTTGGLLELFIGTTMTNTE
ncbi:hypothetical protein Fcan01_04804 [Folsomia candida]|uniref:Arrestin-like N-terminal domain-containing protein n=1 Tax=Folsomia candida TaxID=158441 RepID=A0A226ENI9_FOLCA|nr:hypothetical protein Fcan01_04804 [Folsomia candida]